jgi:hypothetical protein
MEGTITSLKACNFENQMSTTAENLEFHYYAKFLS